MKKSHREHIEKRWPGLTVSEGVAAGRVLRFHSTGARRRNIYRSPARSGRRSP
ncbi:MAG: hypothetical protein WKF84_05415 [Pyrinomonadaceae bacterium]